MIWVLLVLALVAFVVIPVVDYWPASKVWLLSYWYSAVDFYHRHRHG